MTKNIKEDEVNTQKNRGVEWRYLHNIADIMFDNSIKSSPELKKPVILIVEKEELQQAGTSHNKKVEWKLFVVLKA